MTKQQLKDKIADALCVDSVEGLLWNYEPRNYKQGDKIICIKENYNPYRDERIEFGKEYIVGGYANGNVYVKSHVRLEGCAVWWNDDSFQFAGENLTEDVDCIDITNQKLLQ